MVRIPGLPLLFRRGTPRQLNAYVKTKIFEQLRDVERRSGDEEWMNRQAKVAWTFEKNLNTSPRGLVRKTGLVSGRLLDMQKEDGSPSKGD